MEEQSAQREFADGLRNIKQAIAEELAGVPLKATQDDIAHEPPWASGRSIPERIEMHVRPEGAPLIMAAFSREQVEDSWSSLERADVREVVRSIAREYKRLLKRK